MSNKIIKGKKEEVTPNKVTKGSELKAKYIEFRKKHKKLVSCSLAGLLLVGGIGLGFVGSDLYYGYQYYKSQNQVGIDGEGYFLDPILNYAIQFPSEWGYATEEQTVIEKAVEDAKTNSDAFRLSQHRLPYEVTPVVFAKDEGDMGYRSFMSVSFRGFYGEDINETKTPLKTELQELLENNGHTNIEFLESYVEKKDGVNRVIFDVKALSKSDETGEDITTYYHQQSMLIGRNLCTVIIGTTDTKLNRNACATDLILKIIETDPEYSYIKEDEQSSTSSIGGGSSWFKGSTSDNPIKIEGTETNETNKQSIPVEGGSIEIITGTDLDIDALKEMDGINVNDVELDTDSDNTAEE